MLGEPGYEGRIGGRLVDLCPDCAVECGAADVRRRGRARESLLRAA